MTEEVNLTLVKKYLQHLYKDLDDGYDEHCHANTREYSRKGVHTVYGEVTPTGVYKIIKFLTNNLKIKLNKHEVFYDLGSGTGKVTIQMFLMTAIKKAMGIEGVIERDKIAKSALRIVKNELPEFFVGNRQLKFQCANFLTKSLKDASIIFTNAVCFSKQLRSDLVQVYNKLPNLHTVISMAPYEELNIPLSHKIKINCSWDPKATCFVYH